MASKKEMRRADLIIPYVEPPKEKEETDMAGTLASTLPMVAIVTRSKMLGWTALVFAIQSWLAETPAKRAASPTPGYFTVLMGFMSLAVSYLPLFLPPVPGQARQGTGTEAPAAAPPA